MHLVSAQGRLASAAGPMLTPLLMRADRQRFQMQVAYFAPGETQAAVARQSGVPVHELELSRRRFSPTAPRELLGMLREFRPELIHAWGPSAQSATALLKGFLKWRPLVIWNMSTTAPLSSDAGLIARGKLKLTKKLIKLPKQIVYPSAALAAHYRRLGFPEDIGMVIAPGVDTERYKPDFAARKRVREQLKLDAQDFVIGMNAAFLPENDYTSFVKATAEIIKFNPKVQVVIAGRGAQRGNAGLMALLGGGTLAARTTLLGEWSDGSALFNACDVVCSSALNDSAAMTMVMAMLCGVPCVATGKGAQGEVLGQYATAIEPGSPNSMVRAVTRLLEMPVEKRAFMAQAARKHALQNYSIAGSVEKYLELYTQLTVAPETAAVNDKGLQAQ